MQDHASTLHVQQSRELTQKPEDLADATMIFGFDHHDPGSGQHDPGSACHDPGSRHHDPESRHHDPELYYAHYLRAFDELDPHSAIDRVKDEGWPFARGVMLLTVLTDRLKRPKQRFFHC